MDDIQSRNMYTRRTALTLAAAAVPALSQSQTSGQPQGKSVPHPIVYFEIGCDNRARTERFFTDLFGWHTQANGPAATIDTASDHGIPGHIVSLGHDPRHYTMFYVEVENVETYLDKAAALGGKVLVPPVKIPAGTFGWFADIDGNMIGLLKPNR
jgi:predicted enzyme related to lactoylglutathione lyase